MSQSIGSESTFEISLLKQVVLNRENEFIFEKTEKDNEKTYYFFQHKITTHLLVLDVQGKTHMPYEPMGIIPITEWSALNFVFRLESNYFSTLPLDALFGNQMSPYIVHLNHSHRSLCGTGHPVTLPYWFHDEDPVFLFWNKHAEKEVWVDLDLNFYENDRDAIGKPILLDEGIDILLAKGEDSKRLKKEAIERYIRLKTRTDADSARDRKKYTMALVTRYAGSYW